MCGIKNCAASHAVSLGFFDEHIHHAIACDHAHSVVCVHNDGCRGFPDNFGFCDWKQRTRLDAVEIYRLEAVAAVAFNTPAVGFKKDVGAYFCVLLRHAVSNEHVRHEFLRKLPWNIRSGFGSIHKNKPPFCTLITNDKKIFILSDILYILIINQKSIKVNSIGDVCFT